MATRAYLDTNAASYVFERKGFAASELRLLRTRMKDASCAGEIEFVISVPLLEELSGIARRDWSRYRTILDFLFEISGPRLLLEADDRLRGELDNSGPLDGLKPYQSRRFRIQLQAATKVRKNAGKVDDGTYGRKDELEGVRRGPPPADEGPVGRDRAKACRPQECVENYRPQHRQLDDRRPSPPPRGTRAAER